MCRVDGFTGTSAILTPPRGVDESGGLAASHPTGSSGISRRAGRHEGHGQARLDRRSGTRGERSAWSDRTNSPSFWWSGG